MRFSTRSEYGLRLMVNLAQEYSNPHLRTLSAIAKNEELSLAYLERLAVRLKRKKLIIGNKGVNGGYRLARPPVKICIDEIIESLEGDLYPSKCISQVKNKICHKKECLSKKVWFQLYGAIKITLKGIILSDLIDK